VEATASGRRVVEVPVVLEAIQWTAIGYAALQRMPDGSARVVMLDPDRPDDLTILFETPGPVTSLWVTPDPEWILLSAGRADSADEPAGFIVVGPTRTLTVDAPDADGSTASMTLSRKRIVYREGESGRMVERSTTDQGRRVLIDEPVLLGVVSGRDVLAVATTAPGEICVLPQG